MPLDMHNLSYVKIYLSDLKELSWVNPHRKHMVLFLELAGCLLSPVGIIFRSALISFNSTSSRPSSELPRHSNSTLIWPTMGPECYRLRGYNVCLPPVLLLWSTPGVYLLLAEKRQGSWSAQRAISILGIYRVHIKVCSSSQGCQSGAWDTHCSVHDWIKLPLLNVQQLGKTVTNTPKNKGLMMRSVTLKYLKHRWCASCIKALSQSAKTQFATMLNRLFGIHAGLRAKDFCKHRPAKCWGDTKRANGPQTTFPVKLDM